MSRVTKIKHVLKEQATNDFDLPKANQQIVKIVASRGNNLHEVLSGQESNEQYLVSMPMKFRKNVWVKRGDFVLVETIEEGNKVKGEICRILTQEHIKAFEKEGVWPAKFIKQRQQNHEVDEHGLIQNTNRKFLVNHESEDDDDEDERVDSVNIFSCNNA
ncbi:probable RNA-binding protein EIF1AD [Anopheles aquasalis]|uniref:probable RNA-binding protein EIF1AD n=1 Tax=Anopheles aquasalis TaxID=42839 RepID=UPI00215A9FEC|nr:probable RNA-binding protein EIF1AD [Anopheles aquasalis]